jgi:hypothetical protein
VIQRRVAQFRLLGQEDRASRNSGRPGLSTLRTTHGPKSASRSARQFWEIDDLRPAFLVNAVVGGTAAYRREYSLGDTPTDLELECGDQFGGAGPASRGTRRKVVVRGANHFGNTGVRSFASAGPRAQGAPDAPASAPCAARESFRAKRLATRPAARGIAGLKTGPALRAANEELFHQRA